MIQSVDRALSILMVVADQRGEPVPLGKIAQAVELNKSTCSHIVDTLCQRGYLCRVSHSSGYILGAYAYYLTRYKSFQKPLISACNPILKWIHRRTGYTAVLATLINSEKFVISYSETENGMLHERGEVYRGSLYRSATGRVMLANMRPNDLRALVVEIGLPTPEEWPGMDTIQNLERALNRLAQEKIASYPEEEGRTAFGMYLRTKSADQCAIGISVSHEEPLTQEQITQIHQTLRRAVREIEHRLRFEDNMA